MYYLVLYKVSNHDHIHTYLIRPLVIRKHVKIVPGSDGQSLGREALPSHLYLDAGLVTLGVLGAAGQEMTHHVLVDPLLISLRGGDHGRCTQ